MDSIQDFERSSFAEAVVAKLKTKRCGELWKAKKGYCFFHKNAPAKVCGCYEEGVNHFKTSYSNHHCHVTQPRLVCRSIFSNNAAPFCGRLYAFLLIVLSQLFQQLKLPPSKTRIIVQCEVILKITTQLVYERVKTS